MHGFNNSDLIRVLCTRFRHIAIAIVITAINISYMFSMEFMLNLCGFMYDVTGFRG